VGFALSWEKYIRHNIGRFREDFEDLRAEDKKLVRRSDDWYHWTFLPPCQVILFDVRDLSFLMFIVLHNEEHPDMKVIVVSSDTADDIRSKTIEKPSLSKLLDADAVESLIATIKETRDLSKSPYSDFTNHITGVGAPDIKGIMIFSGRDLFKEESRLSERMLYWITYSILTDRKRGLPIAETVDNLRKDAEAIPEGVELRNKIIEATVRLENQMKELEKKLAEEVSGVRQLVGSSRKYLDWKAFTSDLELLRTTHVPKGEFKIQIERLDERIGALNTRLDDLKEVRFARARTILEIVLGAMAVVSTVIAALLATGIIKI
jgi:hypothetical protein